jgi:hypothetical protein
MNNADLRQPHHLEQADGTLLEIPYGDGQAVARLLIEHMPLKALEDALRTLNAHQMTTAPATR